MAKLIKVDGIIQRVKDKVFSLEELQEFVHGWIEIIHLPDNMVMVVNEEGLLKGMDVNPKACDLSHRFIVGDVLVCDSKYIK